MDLDEIADGIAALSIAWLVFVIAFMIAVWGHVAAIRRRLAPEVFPIHWDETAANYGIGVPILQPMYAIFRRNDPGHVPLAVFPFTMEGRDAARQRLRDLELGPQ